MFVYQGTNEQIANAWFLGDVSSHFQVSPSGGWLQPPQVEGEFRWKDAEVKTLMLSITMTWSTTPPYDVPPPHWYVRGFSRLTELGKKNGTWGPTKGEMNPRSILINITRNQSQQWIINVKKGMCFSEKNRDTIFHSQKKIKGLVSGRLPSEWLVFWV